MLAKKNTRPNPFISFSIQTRQHPDNKIRARAVRKDLVLLKTAAKALPRCHAQRYALDGALYVRRILDQQMRTMRTLVKSFEQTYSVYTLEYKRAGLSVRVEGSRGDAKHLLSVLKERIANERRAQKRLSKESGHYVAKANTYAETVGGVHTEPGFWITCAKNIKARRVHVDKYPTTDDRYVGIELEFCAPTSKSSLGLMLSDAGLADYVQLKSDGSVRPKEGDYAHEICILTKESDTNTIVPRVTAVLAAAKAYVNASCGFHVHLDMRTRRASQAWLNLRHTQALLYKMVPATRKKGRAGEQHYCKPVRTKSFHTALRSGDRYVGINAQSINRHNTLEVRLHSSTLDPVKVTAWVDLLKIIVDSDIQKPAATLVALRKQVTVPTELATYVKARIETFKAQHAGESTETESSVSSEAAF